MQAHLGDLSSGLMLCHLTLRPNQTSPEVQMSVMIHEDFTWTLSVASCIVSPQSCDLLKSSPPTMRSVHAVKALVTTSHICAGNSDKRFLEVAERCGGRFRSQDGMYMHAIVYLAIHVSVKYVT